MEKQGIIRHGLTKPEQPDKEKRAADSKKATADELADHTTQRLADAATKKLK